MMKIAIGKKCTGYAGNSYCRERLSTVDLRVLTSLDQLLLILQTLFPFFKTSATLIRRSTVLSLSLLLVFPGLIIRANTIIYLTSFTVVTRGHIHTLFIFIVTY
jgi:hypothetical protein